MIVETIGKPRHIPLSIVKKANIFYGEYLFGKNKKLFYNVKVTVAFEKFSRDNYDYAYCDWEFDNHRSRDFIITIDSKLNKRETLLALAHEMTHLAQYAKGDMKDMMRPAKMIKWQNNLYDCEFDYWSAPWEREARGMEMELYVKYIQCKKRK